MPGRVNDHQNSETRDKLLTESVRSNIRRSERIGGIELLKGREKTKGELMITSVHGMKGKEEE